MTSELTVKRTSAEIFQQPDFLESVCRHVANGGDLVTFSEQNGIPFCDLSFWIAMSVDRDRAVAAARQHRHEYIAQSLSHQLYEIASFDASSLFDDNGDVLSPKLWPEAAKRVVSGFEITESKGRTTTKVKYTDRLRAIELLGKYAGMFVEKVHVEGQLSFAEIVVAAVSEYQHRIIERDDGTTTDSDEGLARSLRPCDSHQSEN